MYPGGKKNSTDGKMAFFIQHCGPEISAKLGFVIRDRSGRVVVDVVSPDFDTFPEEPNRSRGWKDAVNHADIVDPSGEILNNGTLTVEVRMKLDEDYRCSNFIPRNSVAASILRSFMDENTSDVIFEVRGDFEGENQDGKLTRNVLFHAHKFVLQQCAEGSELASICAEYDKSTPVPLANIHPNFFHTMLYYIYGGTISASEWKDHSKDFIDAADKYGVKNFKIEAEAWYVKHLQITVDNVVDELLYADEKNCFLLKEATTNFILENAKEVIASDSFEDIPETKNITREILSLVATMNKRDGKKEFDDPTELSINELRSRLYDEGKDIDGPRKSLIAQLEPLPKRKLKGFNEQRSLEDSVQNV